MDASIWAPLLSFFLSAEAGFRCPEPGGEESKAKLNSAIETVAYFCPAGGKKCRAANEAGGG